MKMVVFKRYASLPEGNHRKLPNNAVEVSYEANILMNRNNAIGYMIFRTWGCSHETWDDRLRSMVVSSDVHRPHQEFF